MAKVNRYKVFDKQQVSRLKEAEGMPWEDFLDITVQKLEGSFSTQPAYSLKSKQTSAAVKQVGSA